MPSQSLIRNCVAGFLAVLLALLTACGKAPEVPTPPTKQDASAWAYLQAEGPQLLRAHRQIIVLLAEEEKLGKQERDVANRVGHQIFHDNLQRSADVLAQWRSAWLAGKAGRIEAVGEFLDYIESAPGLYDADRLAFREALREMQVVIAQDSSLPAIRLHKRIGEDLEAMQQIEQNYEREMRAIFNRFEKRAIELKRERWEDYLASLRKIMSREQIFKDYGVILASPKAEKSSEPAPTSREVDGRGLPEKTVVLTFDDGPHARHTGEIGDILRQYKVPAVFFHVGRNLGNVADDGKVQLGTGAQMARKLAQDGHALANHSFSHPQLSKQTEEAVRREVMHTDRLLKSISSDRSALFRFPYGARTAQSLKAVNEANLVSVMWNVDSLDWADPVPTSIADRVIRGVEKEGRGIILFHDIHERTVKALPLVLDRLIRDGYRFADWSGTGFAPQKAAPVPAAPPSPGYAESWAVVIGIDQYEKWPQLKHAVRDAEAVAGTLANKFGFKRDNVIVLKNQEATRSGILSALHERLPHARLKREDRVFFFFAGHGATHKHPSGREVGYLVPADASPDQLPADGISMSEIQHIAESLGAGHALFIMDACYSGMAFTRGAPRQGSFLRDNSRRRARQMLTAGGADQLVADGGPDGHSIFTWTLLQGLDGKADLNGDGLVTGSELAAYVAPAVSRAAQQTPAFGSMPGSEGGEFIFELQTGTEFLSDQTPQLAPEVVALNAKLDASPAAAVGKTAPVVRDLNGRERSIALPPSVPLSARQAAQVLNDQGLRFYRDRDYSSAEARFTEALKLRPDFALAANNLGFVYFKQGKFPEAARWFENTLKMDPSRAIAYRNMGDAYFEAGDKKRAEQAYRRYLELAPEGAAANHVRERLGIRSN